MRHLLSALTLLAAFAATTQAQTMKALVYNTNGQVIYSGTNSLSFTQSVSFTSDVFGFSFEAASGSNYTQLTPDGVAFSGSTQKENTRANLGFSTNLNTLWTATNASNARSAVGLGATWLTNTNVTNFRTAIGLGANDYVEFGSLALLDGNQIYVDGEIAMVGQFRFINTVLFNEPAETRNSLGLGATNIVTFAGLTNNGDITINQTTATNGLLFIRRTNNEAFLGLANLIASNNTTINNETLFRVGVQEATNKAAQFGFRSTNTNGSGVAVFSVFGFNALMQIGADASTNAVIYSGGGTNNEVMTLIRDGATEFARPLRFSTIASTRPATNAPANTTNVAAWVEMRIGTNSYRVPLYQ